MYVKTRHLSAKEIQELDTLAQKNNMSREQLVTDILRQFLNNTLYLEEHKNFFENEVAEVIQVLEKNNQLFQKAVNLLEKKGEIFDSNY